MFIKFIYEIAILFLFSCFCNALALILPFKGRNILFSRANYNQSSRQLSHFNLTFIFFMFFLKKSNKNCHIFGAVKHNLLAAFFFHNLLYFYQKFLFNNIWLVRCFFGIFIEQPSIYLRYNPDNQIVLHYYNFFFSAFPQKATNYSLGLLFQEIIIY